MKINYIWPLPNTKPKNLFALNQKTKQKAKILASKRKPRTSWWPEGQKYFLNRWQKASENDRLGSIYIKTVINKI